MTAAALVAAAGCESNKDNRSTRSTTRGTSTAVRTSSQTAKTQTVSTARMRESSATLDNVLRITKSLPQEVIAGQPFEYQVTVTNTTDNVMLRNVWIREHAGMSHSMGGQTAMAPAAPRTTVQPTAMQPGHADHAATATTTKARTTASSAYEGPDRDITLDTEQGLRDRRQDPTRPDIRTTGYEQRQGIPTPGPGGAEQSNQPGRLDQGGAPGAGRDAANDINRDLDRAASPDTQLSRDIRNQQQDLNRDLRDMARDNDQLRRDSAGVITQSELASRPAADATQRDAFGQPYTEPRQDPSRPDIRTTGYGQRQGIPTPGAGGTEQNNQPGDLDRSMERTRTTTVQQARFQQATNTGQVGGNWDDRNFNRSGFDQNPRFRAVGEPGMGMGMGQEGRPGQDYFIGDLGPGESRTITVSGSAPSAGENMICTSAAYTPMMCTMVNAIQPFLNITKTGPEEASVGQEINWQVTVTNTGVGPARDVVVIDPLPGDMRTAQGQAEVRYDVGTLNAGESKTFTVSAVAPTTGRFTNIARVTAAGGLTDEAQASTNVRQARLEITKRGPEVEYTNIGANFEIAVTNTGDAPAQNVVLEDSIPRGARFLEASDNGAAGQDRVTWNLGTIPPGQTRTILVRMAGTQAGSMENCATVTAAGLQPARDCATVRFEGIAALLLEVVDVEDPIRVGGRTAYDITVTNQGTAEATNIALDFELDERTSLNNAEGPSPFAKTDTGASFRPIASLGAGQKATFRVFVNAEAAGDTRFRVNMRADQLTRPVVETESTRIVE